MKTRRSARQASPRRMAAPAALVAAALRAQSKGVFIATRRLGPRGFKIIFANNCFCVMTGLPAAKLAGRAHSFLHLEKIDLGKLKHWLAERRPSSLAGEGHLLQPNGATIYVAWNLDPIYNSRGVMTHIVATYQDKTEKHRLQEALMHAQRLDAVGRLAGGVAHDFNNLISVINGYCQILANQLGDRPQALREIEEIHQAGQKAAALTRQLLAFSQRQPMDLRVTNFNQLIQDNTAILERLLDNAGTLKLQLDPNLGNVRADPTQLQQVLLNLVINARDALREDGRVTITTANRVVRPGFNRRSTDAPPGRYAMLTISDNGTGMDANTQAHLFEPFFTTKPEGKGTGLGLALVYGVVQQSGGYISVYSTLMVGSTFEILLPLVNEAVETVPHTPMQRLPVTRGHETVLLVEEDSVVSKMVAGIFTADGYRVLTAQDSVDGLKVIREQGVPIQLLIISLGTGDVENETLVRALHELEPGLRVLSTSTPESLALTWLAPESQMNLPKPFALSELLKAGRKLLDT